MTLVPGWPLDTQAEAVGLAHRREGRFLAGRIQIGDRPTLRLRKRQRPLMAAAVADIGAKMAETPGFGSW